MADVTSTPADADELDVLDSAEAGGMAIRGAALRAGSHALAMTLSLASVPFVIRHLGQVDYGYYMTVTSILFILGGITEAGLTQLGQRYYSVLPASERHGFLRLLVGLRLALTVSGVLAAALFVAATGQPRVVVEGTVIGGFGMLLSLTQQTYSVALSARLRLGWIATLDIIGQFVLAASLVLLVVLDAPLLPFFFAAVASGLAILLSTLAVVRDEATLRPRYDAERWKSIAREVLPYALAAAVGLVYFRLAIVLMSYLSTGAETGIYAAAQRIVEVVAALPWLLATSAFPILARAARDDNERLRFALQRMFEVVAVLGGAVVVAGIAGASFAIDVVAGPGFHDSVAVLQILMLSTVMTFVVATWSAALLSLQRYRLILWANLGAVATTLILSLALIGSHGARGAAIATVSAETALAIGYLIAIGSTDRSLVPTFGVLLKVIPGLVVAAAFGLLVSLPSVVESVVCAGIYLAFAFAMRAVPKELLDALLRRRS